MKTGTILNSFLTLKKQKKCGFAVLIDPDSVSPTSMLSIAEKCIAANVDYVFIGGSLMLSDHVDACIQAFKSVSSIPVILFPGHPSQVSKYADALLFLSMLSSRNPELLIGQHVIAAPIIKATSLEIIPTGYLVIDGGRPTTVSYMSNSAPIPSDKADIALCTAWAGEMQGKQLIYMDAGSGALQAISSEMLKKVSENINIPLVVGGGIRNAEQARNACESGAQIIVVGNAIETNPSLIDEIARAVATFNRT